MNTIQIAKASAPWRTKQCDTSCVISREELLAARVATSPKSESQLDSGLRSMSSTAVSSFLVAAVQDQDNTTPPLAIAPPPGLEPINCKCSDQASVSTADCDTQSDVSTIIETTEYQVLLQNLPKRLMKESILRAMVKEAKLTDVRRLAFRSDGKALITLTSYASLCQCISHFNGMPWFDAPSCKVPVITATYVEMTEKERQSPVVVSSQPASLSADAPSFVPGAALWTAEPMKLPISSSQKCRDFDCCSQISTDGGLSSDEASCGYDSGAEGPFVCA